MYFYNREIIQGQDGKALSIILPTIGCRWRRCNMCSYFEDSPEDVSRDIFDVFIDLFNNAYDNDVKKIKLFTSGSFLDPKEIDIDCAKKIISFISEKDVLEITIESRPEYVKKEYLEDLRNSAKNVQIEVAIGLESSNNKVLQYSIDKGFTFEDFLLASEILKKLSIKNKVYLMIKPPFLTEKEAIHDAINSAKAIENLVDVISFNPMTIHKHTLVEYLWQKKEYSPPWGWSIMEILKGTANLKPDIICHPVAFGRFRGPKNCKVCNREVEERILEFSINNNPKILDYECDCKKEWEKELLKF